MKPTYCASSSLLFFKKSMVPARQAIAPAPWSTPPRTQQLRLAAARACSSSARQPGQGCPRPAAALLPAGRGKQLPPPPPLHARSSPARQRVQGCRRCPRPASALLPAGQGKQLPPPPAPRRARSSSTWQLGQGCPRPAAALLPTGRGKQLPPPAPRRPAAHAAPAPVGRRASHAAAPPRKPGQGCPRPAAGHALRVLFRATHAWAAPLSFHAVYSRTSGRVQPHMVVCGGGTARRARRGSLSSVAAAAIDQHRRESGRFRIFSSQQPSYLCDFSRSDDKKYLAG